MTVSIKLRAEAAPLPDEAELRLVPLAADFAAYRRRVIFSCFKWDPQVGDTGTISDHACLLTPAIAVRLSEYAEALARETMRLESMLASRPDLYAELGIPRCLRRVLPEQTHTDSVRVMRFDFHPTFDGWALSEVNSDVPGGYAEASALPKLAAPYAGNARPAGDVADALVAAFAERLGIGKRVALVHATAFADDRQVMGFLAARFAAAGFSCALLAPDHLRWYANGAYSIAEGQSGPIDGIVRFFPAEWLPALPRHADWRGFFRTRILSCNPGRAVLSQSKRLPLIWDRLGADIPTWRTLLPETRDPRNAPWTRDEGWLVKPAWGRVGEGLAWRGGTPSKQWLRTRFHVGVEPRAWVAQRRFQSRPLMSRTGPRHICIGVFTVNTKACGFYGRLSPRPVIEKHAQDIPILITEVPPCR